MSDLKICRICLRTEAKMYNYDQYQLKYYYEEIMAQKVNITDGLPNYFCYECAMILYKFHKFKEKCYSGQNVLRELLWRGGITYESVYKIDRHNKYLHSNLNKTTNESNIKTFIIKIHEDSNLENEKGNGVLLDLFQQENKPINSTKDNFKSNKTGSKDNRKRWKESKIDMKYWKEYNLTEEEALKVFRKRAEDGRYLRAEFKCADCFRGFSKESMLEGHRRRKHQDMHGLLECRFCRIRYKWKCDLRKHMRQHYTKYECLRCDLVCMQESTMLYHEDYHSGATKKCGHCGMEFRHTCTYYSHLRSHRGGHACVTCGTTFVSQAGLQQHRKVKHYSSPTSEDSASYSETGNTTFETSQAYDKHYLHSENHSDERFESTTERVPNKILKNKESKISSKLKRCRDTEDIFLPNTRAKRKKNLKKSHRKPTTCYQCGKHFSTQAACMKHHHSEHPRTSFFPPAQRHICEICGASLAPGSVAMHVNLHSREQLHTCDTCGRQFHMLNGLKRHLVTHTGEKKFSCPLCDKRFTQSNSMKLHYKTFHLKQPYPKRNRRKKNEVNSGNVEEYSNVDSDSLPDPEPRAGLEPALHAQPHHGHMDYMRL